MTLSKNIILLFKESSKVTFKSFLTILSGIPGNPAPVPISITLELLDISIFFKT